MAQLAIKGHMIRGSEVIALLEMLGGENDKVAFGNNKETYYFVNKESKIRHDFTLDENNNYIIFTLEEFEKKFPYKVGNEVVYEDKRRKITKMVWEEKTNTVAYKLDDKLYCNVINKLQPYKEETVEDKPNLLQQLKDYFDNTPREVIEKEWHQYDKYNEIGPKVNEYLEYVNNIRKPKYPKTYEECHELMVQWKEYDCNPNSELILCDAPIHDFCKLIVARNIYWKIAGEEMGLGEPWEPDYNEESYEQGSPIKYVIYYTGTHITKERKCTPSYILSFPTEEMRDAFYENFKELIEECKELL